MKKTAFILLLFCKPAFSGDANGSLYKFDTLTDTQKEIFMRRQFAVAGATNNFQFKSKPGNDLDHPNYSVRLSNFNKSELKPKLNGTRNLNCTGEPLSGEISTSFGNTNQKIFFREFKGECDKRNVPLCIEYSSNPGFTPSVKTGVLPMGVAKEFDAARGPAKDGACEGILKKLKLPSTPITFEKLSKMLLGPGSKIQRKIIYCATALPSASTEDFRKCLANTCKGWWLPPGIEYDGELGSSELFEQISSRYRSQKNEITQKTPSEKSDTSNGSPRQPPPLPAVEPRLRGLMETVFITAGAALTHCQLKAEENKATSVPAPPERGQEQGEQ